MQLVDVKAENRQGLASTLSIRCKSYQVVNMVQTSKSFSGVRGKFFRQMPKLH